MLAALLSNTLGTVVTMGHCGTKRTASANTGCRSLRNWY